MGSVVRLLFGGLFALLLLLNHSLAQEGSTGIPPNESRTLGKPLPDVMLVDAQGREFNLYSLKGKPIILSPIYTNCSSACPIITDSLKKVVPKLGNPGVDFWVLSLTFDPTDRLENIREFAKKYSIDNRGWKVVMVKDKEDLFKLLDAIDFRFMSIPESKDFVHPNLVVFISPDMKIKRYVYGVVFDEREMKRALEYAKGNISLLEVLGNYMFFVGLVGFSISTLVVVYLTAKHLHSKEVKKAT